MKVILLKDIKKLGRKYDTVQVKQGYAANFLIPKGVAVFATSNNITKYKELKDSIVMKKEEISSNAQKVYDTINNKIYIFKEKASDKGHLFGSITEKEILEKIKEEDKFEIDKNYICLDNHIKEIGEHTVKIKLLENLEAIVTIRIEQI